MRVMLLSLFLWAQRVDAIGQQQAYAVEGSLICDEKPAAGIKVRLYDVDTLSMDDKLDEGVTDEEGYFKLEGFTTEVGNIDPKLNIYHHCGDTGKLLQTCAHKLEVELDKAFITKGEKTAQRIFDAGRINLNAEYGSQSRDCIN